MLKILAQTVLREAPEPIRTPLTKNKKINKFIFAMYKLVKIGAYC